MIRLKKHFDSVIMHDLVLRDCFCNVMETPNLNKVVLNMGLGSKLVSDKKDLVKGLLSLELISKQKSQITRAKKSLDKFKIKKGMVLGCKVTLRNKRMYFFLDSLNNKVLPNLEEFMVFTKEYTKAVKRNKLNSNSFVKSNNYFQISKGIEDHFSFKEIPFDKFDKSLGLSLSFVLKNGRNNKRLQSKKSLEPKVSIFKPYKNLLEQKKIKPNSKRSLNTLLSGFQVPIASL